MTKKLIAWTPGVPVLVFHEGLLLFVGDDQPQVVDNELTLVLGKLKNTLNA